MLTFPYADNDSLWIRLLYISDTCAMHDDWLIDIRRGRRASVNLGVLLLPGQAPPTVNVGVAA